MGSVMPIVLDFCAVILCVFTFWIPCCDVRYDFRIETMFGSSLPPVVCRREHVIKFTLFVFVCVQWCPTHCVFDWLFFLLCTLCCQFFLDGHFCIAPLVFPNVYLDILPAWLQNDSNFVLLHERRNSKNLIIHEFLR